MAKISCEPLEPIRRVLVVTYLGVAAWYFNWRLGTFNPHALAFSILIYAAEVYGMATVLLHLLMTWNLTVRSAPPPSPGLSVDVFIPTYNEPALMVRRTAIAAINMEYPHQTWLLDDGNRPDIALLAKDLGCRYLARTSNEHAKAGNLNNALLHSDADFVAIFDADHAPKREFLMRVLGYFQDRRVGFVQTPQDYYNLDSFEHRWKKPSRAIWTEQSLFREIIQRGKDYWNAAFFCGSCAVLRRRALDDIGGIACGTVTEDLHTSLRIHKKGWHSVYHAESLAFGVAPNSVGPFLTQRIRWGQGAMQVWRREGILFARGLTLVQRLNYFASVLTYFDGWQKGVFYLAPVVVLATGVMPVNTLGGPFLLHFVPYYILTFWVFEELGRGHGRSVMIEQYNMARFAAFCWATLGFVKGPSRFKVTPKVTSIAARNRSYLIPQYGVLLLNAAAIPLGLGMYEARALPLPGLLANSLWALVNGALGLAVVRFSMRRQQRRMEYRFAIPLPALVCVEGAPAVYGTVDDISSDGLRLYVRSPRELAQGEVISGEIYLPSGSLAFSATVSTRGDDAQGEGVYPKAVGCRFIWDNARQRDQLDLFLYGSDLQQRLGRLRERSNTPLELAGLVKRPAARLDFEGSRWSPIIYEVVDDAAAGVHVGLISASPATTGSNRALILFRSVSLGASIKLRAFSRMGYQALSGWTLDEERMQSADVGVWLYSFHSYGDDWDDAPRAPVFHHTQRPGSSAALQALFLCVLLGAGMRQVRASLLLGGAEAGGQGTRYSYLGLLAPLSGTTLRPGFVQRYWLDWAQYRYAVGSAAVYAQAPGLEAALGYTGLAGSASYGAYLGVGYRDTRLTPNLEGAGTRGAQWSLDPQVQVEIPIARQWKLNTIASYALGPDSYWARVRVLRSWAGGHEVGPELVLEGDRDYRAAQVGIATLGWLPLPGLSLGFSAGVRLPQGGLASTGYLAAELSRSF